MATLRDWLESKQSRDNRFNKSSSRRWNDLSCDSDDLFRSSAPGDEDRIFISRITPYAVTS